jgi:hypothetical protein
MVIDVYSSGLALSGIGKTALVSTHPDKEGIGKPYAGAILTPSAPPEGRPPPVEDA